jgi:CRP/FNR family transcriptional regulator, dissimilatory nitrate respiration regulator
MEKYYSIIKKCALFRGIDEKDYGHLLNCLGVQIRNYKAEDYIFLSGDKINSVGIVLSGVVEVMKENLAGNKHILAFLEPSDLFAEGIVCTVKRISPVSVQVKEDATVLFIPYDRIVKSCGNTCDFHIGLIQNMMVVLGEKNFSLNRKLELLTLKGMREKLASYLINESNERGSNMFQIMHNRSELADYLNVSRTSMCRELTRMQEDGLIDFYGHSFKILDKKRLADCLE